MTSCWLELLHGHPYCQSFLERCVFDWPISSPNKILSFVGRKNKEWVFTRQVARSATQMLLFPLLYLAFFWLVAEMFRLQENFALWPILDDYTYLLGFSCQSCPDSLFVLFSLA